MVLVKEYIAWVYSGPYGAHQCSAITFPWRSTIMLCISSPLWSRSEKNWTMAAGSTPSASGVLRGSPSLYANAFANAASSTAADSITLLNNVVFI